MAGTVNWQQMQAYGQGPQSFADYMQQVAQGQTKPPRGRTPKIGFQFQQRVLSPQEERLQRYRARQGQQRLNQAKVRLGQGQQRLQQQQVIAGNRQQLQQNAQALKQQQLAQQQQANMARAQQQAQAQAIRQASLAQQAAINQQRVQAQQANIAQRFANAQALQAQRQAQRQALIQQRQAAQNQTRAQKQQAYQAKTLAGAGASTLTNFARATHARIASLPTPGDTGFLVLGLALLMVFLIPVNGNGDTRFSSSIDVMLGQKDLPLPQADYGVELDTPFGPIDITNQSVGAFFGDVGQVLHDIWHDIPVIGSIGSAYTGAGMAGYMGTSAGDQVPYIPGGTQ